MLTHIYIHLFSDRLDTYIKGTADRMVSKIDPSTLRNSLVEEASKCTDNFTVLRKTLLYHEIPTAIGEQNRLPTVLEDPKLPREKHGRSYMKE